MPDTWSRMVAQDFFCGNGISSVMPELNDADLLLADVVASAKAWDDVNPFLEEPEFRPGHRETLRSTLQLFDKNVASIVPVGEGFHFHAIQIPPDSGLFRILSFRPLEEALSDQYPRNLIKKKSSLKSVFPFIFFWGTEEERELAGLLDQPVVDGCLLVLSVLSDSDRLLPAYFQWIGKKLSSEELSDRVSEAISWLQNVPTNPKVPAPSLPGELLDLMELSRAEGEGFSDRQDLSSSLCSLDRTSFLEAMDRLYPWMVNDGPLSWLKDNPPVADRLWDILNEFPDLKDGSLRVAPWKTGLGSPKSIRVRMYPSRGSIGVTLLRNKHGSFRVVRN